MIYLKHGIVGSVNTISIPNKVKRVHALALKTGMLEDEWNRSRLMGLYLQASTCTLVDCERLFHGAEKKGLLLFNQMLTVYSRHDPDKAKRLFDELIGTCPPDGATYMGLLHALSVGGEPWEAIKVIQQMESRGVQPDPRHYGVAVDSFARTRTPDFIKAAIDILKYFPSAEHEVTINSILSRCVPPSGVKPVSAKDENYQTCAGFGGLSGEEGVQVCCSGQDSLEARKVGVEVAQACYQELGAGESDMTWKMKK
ncbi:BnaC06g18100D [Brassica napus]|uniref:BnaC06g18100D protein n=1 Tax=Brassica napus TaxID=3708 RepID=A0A078GKG3_BRANA|nr:BnaC06g18100D [Brassica napus]